MYENDKRIVLTLDAGGTNFVFSAMQGGRELVSPICLPAPADNLQKCLSMLAEGFGTIKSQLPESPVAISFAFPGPADYEHGIIGDLPNFPAFRGGVALGPYLNEKFGIPVFINNDGNLFAYGEALAGTLPEVNGMLARSGSDRMYKNLIGLTLGTGFGCGVVIGGQLLTGDNGCGGDVWNMRNRKYPDMIAEESVSIRAVRRVYQEASGMDASGLTPKDIFDIAEGKKAGNRDAAVRSFQELGEMAGDTIAKALNMADGLVVIGGGLMGASKYILPAVMEELRGSLHTFAGDSFPCMQMEVFNLSDASEMDAFLTDRDTTVKVPSSDREVPYFRHKKTGVAVSSLGTSRAVSLGAYTFALNQLDTQ